MPIDDEDESDSYEDPIPAIQRIAAKGKAKEPRVRAPRSQLRRDTFLYLPVEHIPRLARMMQSPALGLHLELLRLSGTRWVKRRDGWTLLPPETAEQLGLQNRYVRHRAVDWLRRRKVIEARRTGEGKQLEYRLLPPWGKPWGDVVDLAAQREARKTR